MKKIFIAVGISALVALLFGAYHFADNQFRASHILQDTSQITVANALSEAELQTIVSQKFTYLDRGKQSFVFASADGKYVLKFFDAQQLQTKWFEDEVKFSLERKHDRLIEGYRLAFEKERQNVGLVYLQLKPNLSTHLFVHLIDRFGIEHQVDLSTIPFVIQLKAIPTREIISNFLQVGNVAEAKRYLRQIISMYVKGYSRGIYDSDHNFMYNTGFVEDQPLRLDVGRLCEDINYKEASVYQQDLEKIIFERCPGWLKRHFPRYADEIMRDMQDAMRESKS